MRRTNWAALIGCFAVAAVYAIVFYMVGYYGIPAFRWGDVGQTIVGLVAVVGLIALAVMIDNRIVRAVAVLLAFVVGTWGFQMITENGGSIWVPITALIVVLFPPFVALVVASVAQHEHTHLAALQAATTP